MRWEAEDGGQKRGGVCWEEAIRVSTTVRCMFESTHWNMLLCTVLNPLTLEFQGDTVRQLGWQLLTHRADGSDFHDAVFWTSFTGDQDHLWNKSRSKCVEYKCYSSCEKLPEAAGPVYLGRVRRIISGLGGRLRPGAFSDHVSDESDQRQQHNSHSNNSGNYVFEKLLLCAVVFMVITRDT